MNVTYIILGSVDGETAIAANVGLTWEACGECLL